ncbi:MAG: HEAT repeat domain-containing protein, partial [Planctomycetota bacterium]
VGRVTQGEGGWTGEPACFEVRCDPVRVSAPSPADLLRLLRHPEPLFRAAAARLLGLRRNPAAAAALRGVLKRPGTPLVRAQAAGALVRCGDPSARAVLRALVRDDQDGAARRAAASVLARLPPDRLDAEALAVALAGREAGAVRFASVALARLGAPALRALARPAFGKSARARAAAVRVLARIDDPRAERTVVRRLRDHDPQVQAAAAVALTRPPRALFPQNYGDFARGLEACGRAEDRDAARRLCILAAHASILHDEVLDALVGLTEREPRAIWALRRLVEKDLTTPREWREWWKEERAAR